METIIVFALSLNVLSCFQSTDSFISYAFENPTSIMDEINIALKKNGYLSFSTSKVETKCLIKNRIDNETYVYYDLLDDSGYLILDKNFNIKKYSLQSDLNVLRTAIDSGFSIYYENKVLFYEDQLRNKILIKNIDDKKDANVFFGINNPNSSAATYVEYSNINTYLYNRYGTYMTMTYNGKLSGIPQYSASVGYHQYPESLFVAGNYSEGNCVITAVANAFAYCYEYKNCTQFPSNSSFSNVDPTANSSFYNQSIQEYITIDGINYYYSPKSSTVSIHTIYYGTLLNAIPLSYHVDIGFPLNNIPTLISQTAFDFGYNLSINSIQNPQDSIITNAIDDNHPIIFSVTEDDKYGDHTMMITGYRWYEGTIRLSNHVYIEIDAFCVSVFDGHSAYERWYDLDYLSTTYFSEYRASSWYAAVIGL